MKDPVRAALEMAQGYVASHGTDADCEQVCAALAATAPEQKPPAVWSYDVSPPQAFIDYVAKNYSGEVVFDNPEWHALRLWNAAMKNAGDAVWVPGLATPQQAAPEQAAMDQAFIEAINHGTKMMRVETDETPIAQQAAPAILAEQKPDATGLLACPFCGNTDELYHTGIISCDACGAEGPSYKPDYQAAWNTRAAPPVAQREESRDTCWACAVALTEEMLPKGPVSEVVRDAARWRWLEEHAIRDGGGNGFTIHAFVPFDMEDMGTGVDAAIAAAPKEPT